MPLVLGGHASPETRCLWCPSLVIRLGWPDRGDPPCAVADASGTSNYPDKLATPADAPQRTEGVNLARLGLKDLFITLAPGPRGPMLFSTLVLVCLAVRTQDNVVVGQSGKRGTPPHGSTHPDRHMTGMGGYEASPPLDVALGVAVACLGCGAAEVCCECRSL